jgi:energy-coupling factor transport system permease protein
MYRLTSAFLYEKRETLLHTIDPRIKFSMVVLIFILGVLARSLILQVFLLGVEASLAAIAKSGRRWLGSLLSIAPFFALVFLVNYLVEQNLILSFLPSLRLLVLVGIFSLFFISTPPDTFALMLNKLGFPQTISLAFSMALRFIPVLAQEAQDIIDAQKSRGLSLDSKNPFKRLRKLLPILIPLIILSIKRSIEIAEALEARAFDLSKKRSTYLEIKIRGKDIAFLTGNLILFLALFYLNSYKGFPI